MINILIAAVGAVVYLACTLWARSCEIGIFAPIIYGCMFLLLMIFEMEHD